MANKKLEAGLSRKVQAQLARMDLPALIFMLVDHSRLTHELAVAIKLKLPLRPRPAPPESAEGHTPDSR